MNKYRTSAITVLKTANKPLHYREITARALEEGLLETEGATPEASMIAQITMDIRHKGNDSHFIKTAPATYALNPNRPVYEQPQKTDQQKVKTITSPSATIPKEGF